MRGMLTINIVETSPKNWTVLVYARRERIEGDLVFQKEGFDDFASAKAFCVSNARLFLDRMGLVP